MSTEYVGRRHFPHSTDGNFTSTGLTPNHEVSERNALPWTLDSAPVASLGMSPDMIARNAGWDVYVVPVASRTMA